ncbi:MAG: cytochrome c [Methylophilaceae bacterium]|jgi:cytochrome c55X|nr:cytochrome c [Methylophilaceae bacterium]
MDTFPVVRRPRTRDGGSTPSRLRAALFLTLMSSLAGWAEDIRPERKADIIRLVRNDCGSCHGGKLKGGLGPALRPESLRDKAPESLRETILHGRAGGAMPPWSDFLSAEEADWIVEQLMKGFPNAR